MNQELLPQGGCFPGREEYAALIARLEAAENKPIRRVCYRWCNGQGSVSVFQDNLCQPFTGKTEPRALTAVTGEDPHYDYLLYLPANYGLEPGRKWPVIWFFHGIGERGDNVWDVMRYGVPQYLAQGNSLDAIVIAPQCHLESHWADTDQEVEIHLRRFIPEMMARYAIDPARMYLTGLSMGGRCSWKTALAMPDLFAALAPVCGRTNTYEFERLVRMPIYMVHGLQDSVIPFENVGKILPVLLEKGHPDITLTIYPHQRHDAWTDTYGGHGFYEWLLSHHL